MDHSVILSIISFCLSLCLTLLSSLLPLSFHLFTLSTQRLIPRVIKLLSRAYKSELILYSQCLASIIVHNCHLLSSYVPATMLSYALKLYVLKQNWTFKIPTDIAQWHLHYISFLHVRKLRHT